MSLIPIAGRIRVPLLALAAAGALVAAGCGSDDNGTSSSASTSGGSTAPAAGDTSAAPAPGGKSLTVSADPGGALKFNTTELSTTAGKLTLTMDNPSSVPHAVAIEGNGVDEKGETVTKDGVSKVTVTLKKGTYTFYCPVDGHQQAGMEGKLTVK